MKTKTNKNTKNPTNAGLHIWRVNDRFYITTKDRKMKNALAESEKLTHANSQHSIMTAEEIRFALTPQAASRKPVAVLKIEHIGIVGASPY